MTFAGFPRVSELEALSHSAALRAASMRIEPAVALGELTRDAESIELHALGARALYTVRSAGQTRSIFADTAKRVNELDESALLASAADWLPGASFDRKRLTEVDQWTPQKTAQLPLLRVRAHDAQATEIHLSLLDGEVVQLTTARSRLLGWIGAIPHWIYPVLLRRHASAWRSIVITLSALGAIASASGIIHGLAVARIARRSARGTRLSLSPFRDRWLSLHHWLGLVFGILSFTWVLSGMLSFYPFASSAESFPSAADVSTFRAAPLDPLSFTRSVVEALDECERSLGSAIKRIEWVVAGHRPFYVCTNGRGASRIVGASDDTPAAESLTNATIAGFARPLGKGAAVESETILQSGDDYYYPTHFEPELRLPVLRTRFASGLVTYVSPQTLRIERRYSRAGAAYRWLYHGLHSLDLPALYRRASLWHAVIVTALLGGCLLAGSGVWISVRAASRRSRCPWRARRSVAPKQDSSEVGA